MQYIEDYGLVEHAHNFHFIQQTQNDALEILHKVETFQGRALTRFSLTP
jgi:hypothetical protein